MCFDNVCGVYDERVVYSNLYLFVVADAGKREQRSHQTDA
ncbi:MAG: hypothetical protein MSA20_00190 [Bacteroidales bacterium]|nr:hypothetical protein [Bacteroidales bacterium]